MTEIEQRTAVAVVCGWEDILMCRGKLRGYPPKGTLLTSDDDAAFLPDYPNDLNAMHEAEKTLTSKACYIYELCKVCGGLRGTVIWNVMEVEPFVFATASQRCEAFLRTVGKWKGE